MKKKMGGNTSCALTEGILSDCSITCTKDFKDAKQKYPPCRTYDFLYTLISHKIRTGLTGEMKNTENIEILAISLCHLTLGTAHQNSTADHAHARSNYTSQRQFTDHSPVHTLLRNRPGNMTKSSKSLNYPDPNPDPQIWTWL